MSPQVQHIVPEVTIPPEVTPENTTTYIVDSGGVRVVRVNFMTRRSLYYCFSNFRVF